jgi:hypothetical protein
VPTLGTLAAGIKPIANTRRGEVYLTELDEEDRPSSSRLAHRKFQYFPDTIADTKAVNYQTKEVPGGSLPLYQYINSGERALSFTVYFTTDVDHLTQVSAPTSPGAVVGSTSGDFLSEEADNSITTGLAEKLELANERFKSAGAEERNPYIPAALAWLRSFLLPRYAESSDVGVPLTKPPRKLLLHIPGSNFEVNGGLGGFSHLGSGVVCIMTTCDINYEALFPSGNPRIVTVSLAFNEVPQRGGVVRFPQVTQASEVFGEQYRLQPHLRAPEGGGLPGGL